MIYIATRKGNHKAVSEDAVLVGSSVFSDTLAIAPFCPSGFVCVADGVGGNSRGDLASTFILKELSQIDVSKNIANDLNSVNDRLLQYARDIAPNMASTLTGFFWAEDSIRLIHIGNSRAYIRQGKYLKQITSDHTTYQWLMSLGRTDEANSCNKSEILGCFGGGNPQYASCLTVSLVSDFETALLTTDGVHDCLSVDALEGFLSDTSDGMEICTSILSSAIEAGSSDDITVVLIRKGEK